MAGFRWSRGGDRGPDWAAYFGGVPGALLSPAGPKETRITARVVMAG